MEHSEPQKAQQKQLKIAVKYMIRNNLREVLGIEQLSFEYPWTEEDFLQSLRQRNCHGMVAEHGERVIGFMIYELNKNRIRLLSIAVHPAWRRLTAGNQLMKELIAKLSSDYRPYLTLEVRETNLPAQLFFKQQGFRATRILRHFYEDSGEDAFFMEYCIGNPTNNNDFGGKGGVNRLGKFL